jgi:hypothetical protein
MLGPMARFHWGPRRSRISLDDSPVLPQVPDPARDTEPLIDTSDLSVLVRAYFGPDLPALPEPTALKDAQLTVSRYEGDIFADRQIYIFVDDEPWGKVRYGDSITRELKPGRHKVRAFNTLFSRTIELDLHPAEHARVRCGNGFPRAGWFLMMWLHATYLLVRLEREPADS